MSKWDGKVPFLDLVVDNPGYPVKQHRCCHSSSLVFLITHAHSDHTRGFHASWDKGKVHCSEITARLLRIKFDLDKHSPLSRNLIVHREWDTFQVYSGVMVSCLPAWHCPGSIMFLIQSEWLAPATTFLCTGDFRFEHNSEQCQKDLISIKQLLNEQSLQSIDQVICDVTFFSDRSRRFESRESSIARAIQIARKTHAASTVFVSSQMLGIEPLLLALCQTLGRPLKCDDPRRFAELSCLDELKDLMFTNQEKSKDEEFKMDDECCVPPLIEAVTSMNHRSEIGEGQCWIRASAMSFARDCDSEMVPMRMTKERSFQLQWSMHSSKEEIIAFLQQLPLTQGVNSIFPFNVPFDIDETRNDVTQMVRDQVKSNGRASLLKSGSTMICQYPCSSSIYGYPRRIPPLSIQRVNQRRFILDRRFSLEWSSEMKSHFESTLGMRQVSSLNLAKFVIVHCPDSSQCSDIRRYWLSKLKNVLLTEHHYRSIIEVWFSHAFLSLNPAPLPPSSSSSTSSSLCHSSIPVCDPTTKAPNLICSSLYFDIQKKPKPQAVSSPEKREEK